MEEQLISFETAKLAKEKLFPQSRKAKGKFRDDGSTENLGIGGAMVDTCKEWYERPTQSLLAKWLREKHNIHLIAYKNINIDGYDWCYITTDGITNINSYKTYEEAYEIGLQEALKLIK